MYILKNKPASYAEQEAGRNERETDEPIIIVGSISTLLSTD